MTRAAIMPRGEGRPGAVAVWLPGGRLHLQHGPIDLILQGWGDPAALDAAYRQATRRFATILEELSAELSALRAPEAPVTGATARIMAAAVAPFRPAFITPMAAVAGAVAETVLSAFVRPGIARAYANNGGDIALHLAPDQSLTAAIATPGGGRVTVRAADGVRGIATSGWRGRSWSFGIADAVTVLAPTAAMADAAATMIANAVDLPGHPAIMRHPANTLQADSDLGPRLVTTDVGPLAPDEVEAALDRGCHAAEAFRRRRLVAAAALFLQSRSRTIGPLALSEPSVA